MLKRLQPLCSPYMAGVQLLNLRPAHSCHVASDARLARARAPVCTKAAAWPIRAMIPTLTALRIAPRVTPLSELDLVRHLERAGFTIERTLHLGSRRMSPIIVARRFS